MESPIGRVSGITRSEVFIYPNPAGKTLNIDMASTEPCLISIYDINGKQLSKNGFNNINTSIDISHLADGFYHILITTKGLLYRKNFLIQND